VHKQTRPAGGRCSQRHDALGSNLSAWKLLAMHIENVSQKKRGRTPAITQRDTHAQVTVQKWFDRMRIGLKFEASLATVNE